MSELLAIAAVVFLVRAFRELAFVRRRIRDGKKPWVCDLCMCFWASLAVSMLLDVGADAPGLERAAHSIVWWWGRASLALVMLEVLELAKLLDQPKLPSLPQARRNGFMTGRTVAGTEAAAAAPASVGRPELEVRQ